jgi:Putative DNA-binding domain
MTLLGSPLHQLTVQHLQSFLENAESEPLLWEAKSGADKKPIRKAICGFANGEQPGYLIIGAVETDGGWELPGAEFPGDDPPVWISEVIRTELKPRPLIDVRSMKVALGRRVAVIEIPPVAIPPCMAQGTVFERISGATVPVEDPGRLSDLYRRGKNAEERAAAAALNAAIGVIEDPDAPGAGSNWPRVALAVSATGHPPDISSRLFSESFETSMVEIVKRELIPPTPGAPENYGLKLNTSFEQSNRRVNCEDLLGHGHPCYWHVRVIWDGTVVICGAWDIDSVQARHISEELINIAWTTASKILAELGGYGPTHMELQIHGGAVLIGAPQGNPMPRIQIGRGPLEFAPDERLFSSVERELRRSTGEFVYEPAEEP